MTDLLHTKTQYPEEFEKFWKAYPRRTGSNPKNQAYRAWRKEFLVDQTADKKETLPPKLPDCSRKKDLYNKVGGDTYNLWLSGCQILGNTIVVSSKLKADWIKNHYGKELWQLGFDGITTKSV